MKINARNKDAFVNQESFRMIYLLILTLIVPVSLAVLSAGKALADDAGRDTFDALLKSLYEDGSIPSLNGTVVSYGDYVDEMAEMGFYRLTPIGESRRFVLSVHIQWNSASRTPNTMNSGCGLFFHSKTGTNNHLMVSLRMDGVLYFSGSKDNKLLSFAKMPYAYPNVEGDADLVLIANDEQMKLLLNGEEILNRNELPVMGDVFGLANLSGTNLDYGIRCTGKDLFVYTW